MCLQHWNLAYLSCHYLSRELSCVLPTRKDLHGVAAGRCSHLHAVTFCRGAFTETNDAIARCFLALFAVRLPTHLLPAESECDHVDGVWREPVLQQTFCCWVPMAADLNCCDRWGNYHPRLEDCNICCDWCFEVCGDFSLSADVSISGCRCH